MHSRSQPVDKETPCQIEGQKAEETLDTVDDPEMELAQPRSLAITLPAEIARSWLVWQCQMVAGVIHGAVFSPDEVDGSEDLLATWPEGETHESILNELSQQVIEEGNGVIRSLEHYGPGDLSTCDLVGCPLVSDDQIVGVVVLMISSRSESQQRAILQLLQWGGVWIEKLIGQRIIHQTHRSISSRHRIARYT